LKKAGFTVEHLEVERDVKAFASVEEGLAAALGLQERWKQDGRWFRYVKFLEDGGRTLTRAQLVVKAGKTEAWPTSPSAGPSRRARSSWASIASRSGRRTLLSTAWRWRRGWMPATRARWTTSNAVGPTGSIPPVFCRGAARSSPSPAATTRELPRKPTPGGPPPGTRAGRIITM